ncbi:MAG TPA: hypothetical protein VF553_09190 [Pyrinomonadaceae bacterium]|jgi:hypothetical protein
MIEENEGGTTGAGGTTGGESGGRTTGAGGTTGGEEDTSGDDVAGYTDEGGADTAGDESGDVKSLGDWNPGSMSGGGGEVY